MRVSTVGQRQYVIASNSLVNPLKPQYKTTLKGNVRKKNQVYTYLKNKDFRKRRAPPWTAKSEKDFQRVDATYFCLRMVSRVVQKAA